MSRRGRTPVPALPSDVWQQIQLQSYKDKHASLRQQMTLLVVSRDVHAAVNQPQCWQALFARFWAPQGLPWELQRQALRLVWQVKLNRDGLLSVMRKQPALYNAERRVWLWKPFAGSKPPGMQVMRKVRDNLLQKPYQIVERGHRNKYALRLGQLERARAQQTKLKRRYHLQKRK